MRIVSTKAARANFSEVVGSVYYTGEPIVVEKKGKRVAVIVSLDTFEQFQTQRSAIADQFGRAVATLRSLNQDRSEAEVTADISNAVNEVRRARRAGIES